MVEKKNIKINEKVEDKDSPTDNSDKHLHAHNHEPKKSDENNFKENKEIKVDEKKEGEVKTKEKKEVVKDKPIIKKDFAVVRAPSVHMSKRHGMYICAFIKGKSVDKAIAELGEVILLKRAVPFKGEIPHRKGKMMSGRYPVDASKLFIPMLKNLKGAILFNGMDITKAKISSAYANFAPKPQRRGGSKGKRAYITLEAREINK